MTCTLDQLDNATTYRVTVHATTGAGQGRSQLVTATTGTGVDPDGVPEGRQEGQGPQDRPAAYRRVTTTPVSAPPAKVCGSSTGRPRSITKRGRVVLLRKTQRPFTVTPAPVGPSDRGPRRLLVHAPLAPGDWPLRSGGALVAPLRRPSSAA